MALSWDCEDGACAETGYRYMFHHAGASEPTGAAAGSAIWYRVDLYDQAGNRAAVESGLVPKEAP